MCGIFGYLLRDEHEGLPSLDGAIAALHHRGPDDRGTFARSYDGFALGLAHTRLSIVDLSPGGHQPMVDEERRAIVVFNGELYNHRELRAELESLGERFRSTSDTEVLLRGWARWGHDVLHRLRGMFALAIWDEPRRRLLLARDRLGVKPLYYARTSRGLVFASEVRALLATGAAERRLCPAGLRSYLAFGSVREPHTILRDVRALPPGHLLELHEGRGEIRAWWELPMGGSAPSTERDAVARTRELLERAVDQRMIADVPVGVFLSGGIDSSAIVALASRASRAPVHTFTLSFDEQAWDERRFAREVAERFGCNHHEVVLPVERAERDLDGALAALDQPSSDGPNSYFVSKAAREAGLVVALSGIGADEVFGGYGYFQMFRRIWPLLGALRGAAAVAPPIGSLASRWDLSPALRKLVALGGTHGQVQSVYDVLRGMLDPRQVNELLGRARGTTIAPPPAEPVHGDLDPVQAWSMLDLTHYVRDTLLRDTDAMSMAHALEVREPFLDHELVEHVLQLPAEWKLRRGAIKPHLCAAVPELPRSVVDRRKMGFTLPFEAWLRGPMRAFAEERLLGATRSTGALDAGAVERLWRGYLQAGADRSCSRVWAVVALMDWCERHRVTL